MTTRDVSAPLELYAQIRFTRRAENGEPVKRPRVTIQRTDPLKSCLPD